VRWFEATKGLEFTHQGCSQAWVLAQTAAAKAKAAEHAVTTRAQNLAHDSGQKLSLAAGGLLE
jgi:hypothetical protein